MSPRIDEHRAREKPRRALALSLALVTSACVSLEHAPGPEDPSLIAATRGTVIVTEARGFVRHSVELVDLPSLRTLELRVPGGWALIGGLDDAGRIAYMVPGGPVGWELRLLDVASLVSVKLLDLERSPWRMRQAPIGGTVVPWKERNPGLEIVAFESPARRPLDPAVGSIEEVHWLPDGRTLAVNGKLDGKLGGALVDVATGEIRERSPSYGPFSPCGETFLAEREGRLQLIERSTGAALAAPAQFPWPYQQQGDARELPDPWTDGLCGRHLGLYPALPTEGMPTRRAVATNGAFVHEFAVLKVSDVVSGAHATLRFHTPWDEWLLYSPARLTALVLDPQD